MCRVRDLYDQIWIFLDMRYPHALDINTYDDIFKHQNPVGLCGTIPKACQRGEEITLHAFGILLLLN